LFGELKDIALIVDGRDPLADRVRAGVALRLSYHYGRRTDNTDQLTPTDIQDETLHTFVEFCGIREPSFSERHGRRQALITLRQKARDAGHWIIQADVREFLETVRCTGLVIGGSALSAASDAIHPSVARSRSYRGVATELRDLVRGTGRKPLLLSHLAFYR
jgi:hypothetical protein